MTSSPPVFALIVGIDRWLFPKMPALKGCVNDVQLMQQVFREQFGVADENIIVLTDEQATRKAITDAFHTHLIERAKAWRNSGSRDPSPAFVFHFSGHGSRARDQSGTQPDGLDETIVPYDSRVGDVYDIKDWELAGWLNELTSHTDNVTIILDCCHSGSGTRNAESVGTRRVGPPDLRPQPQQRPSTKANGTRGSEAPRTDNRYVLLAACRNFEYAEEYTIANPRHDDANPSHKNADGTPTMHKHGAFTWFLAEELMKLPSQHAGTYSELYQRVRFQVSSRYATQTPQCEGDRDRVLFGGARVVRDSMLSVIKVEDDQVWIDGGIAHGISIGDQLSVYASDVRSVDESSRPLSTLSVVNCESVRSQCVVANGGGVGMHCRVKLPVANASAMRHRVAIKVSDPTLDAQIRSRFGQSDIAAYIELVNNGTASDACDFRVVLSGDELLIQSGNGRLLVKPMDRHQIDEVASDLASLCRYKNVLHLNNPSAHSGLNGRLSVRFHAVGEDSPQAPNSRQRPVRNVEPIRMSPDGLPIVEVGQPIAIEVTNQSDQAVYLEAISFGYDYAIVPLTALLTAPGNRKRVEAGGTLWFGRDQSDRRIIFSLPADPGAKKQFTEANEFLKVIATIDEADFEILRQKGLKLPPSAHRSASTSGLDALFSQAMAGTRALGVQEETTDVHDWTTVIQEYVVTRPSTDTGQSISGGNRVKLDAYDTIIEAPDGFDCNVQVVTPLANVRSTVPFGNSSRPLPRPSGMIWESDLFQPLALAPHRSSAPHGDAIAITAQADAFSKVSTDCPLKISNGRTSDRVIAVAWDGDCAYPVGTSDLDGEVAIGWFPSLDSENIPIGEDVLDGGKRSLIRTVKLYLYKLCNWESPELGLHQVRLVASDNQSSLQPGERIIDLPTGEAHYRKINDQQLDEVKQTPLRMVLLVHDFSSDSQTMMTELWQAVPSSMDSYDHVLAYDYETFHTPIIESGEQLSKALVEAGFKVDDGWTLDIIAVGMGALVARSMIEQFGGQELVDRCFFAGPPNAGTALMKSKQCLPWISTALLNAAGPNPVSLFFSAAIKKIESDAKALADLMPKSEFLRSLSAAARTNQSAVPYHITAGSFDGGHESANAWIRASWLVSDLGLRTLFADHHDLIVDTSSMIDVPSKNVSIDRVNCHHFAYLRTPKLHDILARWIAQP